MAKKGINEAIILSSLEIDFWRVIVIWKSAFHSDLSHSEIIMIIIFSFKFVQGHRGQTAAEPTWIFLDKNNLEVYGNPNICLFFRSEA